MATSINNTIASRGYSSQVDASGAGDFEPSWSTYARPDFWIAGYASAYQWPTYDFGSADGCPHSGTQTSTARSCNNGWTQASVRWLSYGSPPTYAVPESYTTNGVQASQWYYISKYQTLAFGYRIYFSGVLTQSGACAQRGGCSGTNNSPSQGYLQLYNDINSDSATSGNITWSLDIRWDS